MVYTLRASRTDISGWTPDTNEKVARTRSKRYGVNHASPDEAEKTFIVHNKRD